MGEGNGWNSTDAELVGRARDGDREAFAAIYDRYADRLHDFCLSLLRNRDDAADATQDAFLRAVERLGQLNDPAKLRPWLYSIARHEALARLRARKRQTPDDTLPETPDPAAAPDVDASRNELRDLVWAAAAGLGDRDRVLLDLHVRQGLDGAEFAEAAGVAAGHAYVLLNRMRNQVERSLGALLVARLGRDDCADLDAILAGWDGRFSALIRKRVARHVDACDVCGERRRTAASPMALLSAVPIVAAPAELRDVVLAAFDVQGHGGDDASGSGASGTHPPDKQVSGPGRRVRAAVLAGGAVVVMGGLVAVLAILSSGADDGVPAAGVSEQPSSAPDDALADDDAPASPPSVTSQTPLPTAPAEPSPTDPAESVNPPPGSARPSDPPPPVVPGELSVATTSLDLGSERVAGIIEVRNSGGSALEYQASVSVEWLALDHGSGELQPNRGRELRVTADRDALPEGDHTTTVRITSPHGQADVGVALSVERPPVVDVLGDIPAELGIRGCVPDNALVRAEVTDESDVGTVELSWQGPDVTHSTAMTLRSGYWYGRVGPFSTPGEAMWFVVAVDSRGNVGLSQRYPLTILPCPQ